jgi:hypothetical protein
MEVKVQRKGTGRLLKVHVGEDTGNGRDEGECSRQKFW